VYEGFTGVLNVALYSDEHRYQHFGIWDHQYTNKSVSTSVGAHDFSSDGVHYKVVKKTDNKYKLYKVNVNSKVI
jgi:hypothetical protein